MLLTPEGKPAGKTDRVMLLSMWARKLHRDKAETADAEKPVIIFAGMGKPTFPINDYAAKSALSYWSTLWSSSQEARHLLSAEKSRTREVRDRISKLDSVADYGLPQGELLARTKMAKALCTWYPGIPIDAKNILFTVGGAASLHNIFEVINRLYPAGRIITPFPHYSLYAGSRGKNRLHPIYVMKEDGYRLTAAAVEREIKHAIALGEKDGGMPSAFLLCDPLNPLGTLLTPEEAKAIAAVLRRYPDIYIILDEAYAEMCLSGQPHASLLRIAPDLRNRIILMRSATKALSAAGERMAVTITFDQAMMAELVQENIDICGHAPKSQQIAFAEAMERLDAVELGNLVHYYKPQVELVVHSLATMGASMPDPRYKVNGTFYVIGDFSDLIGLELPASTRCALNRSGFIETDEDIIYYLLFVDGIMVAPLSYFAGDAKSGYLRITCSGGDSVLEELMVRLERRLVFARKTRQDRVTRYLSDILPEIKAIDPDKHSELVSNFSRTMDIQRDNPDNALALKKANSSLESVALDATRFLRRSIKRKRDESAVTIQAAFRGFLGRKDTKAWKDEVDGHWRTLIDKSVSSKRLKGVLNELPPSDRLSFTTWRAFLKKHYGSGRFEKHEVEEESPTLLKARL
jgi:aspartate aminotransferase/aminotransferase